MRFFRVLPVVLLFALLIFSPAEPRPGGGGHYSGGRGRSGSSRSYSGGGGYRGGGGSGSCDTVPGPVWVIVFFVVAGILLVSSRRRSPTRARTETDPRLQAEGLRQLMAQDPAFSLPAFLERSKATLLQVNQAWIQGDMRPARRIISDAVFIRFQTQLALMRAQGVRNVMADMQVLSASLLAAQTDTHFDTLHVKVVAQARDIDVSTQLSDEEAQKKAARSLLASYEEVWSFLRKRGKKSKQGVPALEGMCPSCGATLAVSDTVQCGQCKALVNSPEHDWVLSEITQPEEWEGLLAVQAVPGLADLQQKDPGVSRQALEDQASVLFWKWMEAKNTGSTKKLQRFCAGSLDDAGVRTALQLEPVQLERVAVGSVDVRGVVLGGEKGVDRIQLEVRWSGARPGGNPESIHHLFEVVRKVGVKSPRGLYSLDCPVCRGPLGESDAVTCPYCQSALQGPAAQWSLERVVSTR